MGQFMYEPEVSGLGPFTGACRPIGMRDWRRFYKDEFFTLINVFVTQNGWNLNRTYQALTGGGDFLMEFRDPDVSEEGGVDGNCGGTTVRQEDFQAIEIRIPNLETIRIQEDAKDNKTWRHEFCSAYPRFQLEGGFTPFIRSGNGIELAIEETQEIGVSFAQFVAQRIQTAWAKHLAQTTLYGRKEAVDQFDGIFTLLENGIESVTVNPNYPLAPARIDFGRLVTGLDGAVVHPASTVPENHPPVILFPDTILETIFPVAGKNAIEIQGAWVRKLRDWGYNIPDGAMRLIVGNDQTECITRLAGCAAHCTTGSCVNLYYDPPMEVINRAAEYINNKYVQYWPSTERVPLIQSNAVGRRNWQMLMPLQVYDEKAGGFISLFSVVMTNMQAAMNNVLADLRPLDLSGVTYGMFDDTQPGFTQDDPNVEELLSSVPAGVMQITPFQDRACFGFLVESEATAVLEMPEVILILEGISCEGDEPSRIVLPEDVPEALVTFESVTAVAANPTFNSALSMTVEPMETWLAGDNVYYAGEWGTSVQGVVRSYDPTTGALVLDFEQAGVIATFGGGDLNARVYGLGSANYARRFIRECAGAAGALTLVFDWDNGAFPAVAGDTVRIVSALRTNTEVVEIGAVTANTPLNTEIDVTTTVVLDCNWDLPVGQDPVSLAHGGYIEFVWANP